MVKNKLMTQRELQWNQIETDLQFLKEDVEAGLYENNLDGFLKEMGKITEKASQTIMMLPELMQSPKDAMGSAKY